MAVFLTTLKEKADFWGYMSLVKMAEAVGIGKVGKNGLLFNSKYGPRLFWVGLLPRHHYLPWPGRRRMRKDVLRSVLFARRNVQLRLLIKVEKWIGLPAPSIREKPHLFKHDEGRQNSLLEDVQMINHLTAVDDHSMYRCIQCVSVCPYL